ncbi:hypothetical protein EJB05_11636, partial [Eragrostis curvula]
MWFTAGSDAADRPEQAPAASSFSPVSSQLYSYSLRISSSPKPHPQNPRNRALASAISSAASHSSSSGCGLGGRGSCGGGGGGGGGFLSTIFSAGAARAEEGRPPAGADWDAHGLAAGGSLVPLSRLDGAKRYKVSELDFVDRRAGPGPLAAEDIPLFGDTAALRAGGVYTRSELLKELNAMASSGVFEQVTIQGKPMPDGSLGLTVSYAEPVWTVADRLRCVNAGSMPRADDGFYKDMTERERMEYFRRQERDYVQQVRGAKPCILPEPVQEELLRMVKRQNGKLTSGLLQRISRRVEKWYQDEGFACASVVSYGILGPDEVVCEVLEGDITKVEYQFLDKLSNIVEGNTAIAVIDRELPQQLRPGHIYNSGAGKQAFKNFASLGLFSSVQLNARPDGTEGVVLQIKLQEQEPKLSEVTAGWSIVPGCQGRPTLASIQPGGSVTIEHRNISGLNRSLVGSMRSEKLLNPQDDLSFKLEYTHPYLDGVEDHSRNRTFKSSCFNSRKLSPVFVAGPNMEEAPPVWIERIGFKANVTESFTRQSKFTYGLVVEQITARDENNNICTHGSRALPSGFLSMDGPPTTFSGTGVDRMAFLQANITRDNTEFVNGATIGDRCIFQLDQGLGIGSKNPFFNRHQISITKFINLNKQEKDAGKPPPAVLAIHGRYAGCVGDLPSYDAYPIGGPHSVRGYGMGELGASRNLLEVATELRIPITVKNTHAQVYAFAEHGTDIGSSKDVEGNPTNFFRRVGHGSSYGVGVKLGMIRAEYAVDQNAGRGAFFVRFGERF